MIIKSYVSSTEAGKCVICKKKVGNFVSFRQKSDDIEIKICVCREHEGIFGKYFDFGDSIERDHIKVLRLICNQVDRFGGR